VRYSVVAEDDKEVGLIRWGWRCKNCQPCFCFHRLSFFIFFLDCESNIWNPVGLATAMPAVSKPDRLWNFYYPWILKQVQDDKASLLIPAPTQHYASRGLAK